MRRALVTGATGFIGRNVVARLEEEGWTVAGAVRSRPAATTFCALDLGPSPWGPEAFEYAFAEFAPDVVFHMAGVTQAASAADFYKSNTVLVASLLQAVQDSARRPAVVLAGSAAEYGLVGAAHLPVSEVHPCAPVTDYGISKYAQTLMGLARMRGGLRILVARIFNPVGPRMPCHLALASFAAQLRGPASQSGVLEVGDLEVERDFIDVAEAARLIVCLSSDPARYGAVYNICSGRAFHLRSLVEELVSLGGRRVSLVTRATRLRAGEMRAFYGDTSRLDALGLHPRAPDFARLLPELLSG
jgi:GDP-4-dehydro-6-deoxy-D-mannose reductase